MGSPTISSEDLWAVFEANNGNVYQTAKQLGLNHSGLAKRIKRLKEARGKDDKVVLPTFPDDDIPTEDIIGLMSRRFRQRWEHQQAKKWFEIKLPDGPFGLMMWGDPHLDSNGCNWPLLERHIAIARQPAIYSLNIGDVLDNWPHGSRLIRLYAHSDTSVETAKKLAQYFLGSGKGTADIRWLVHVLGNHDTWPGHNNIKALVPKPVICEDHGVRFVIKASGVPFRVWARHDFPGHSEINTLHGMEKAAKMKEQADLYVSGHKHNWALKQEESASRAFVYWTCRLRGYKYIDDHADNLSHDPQEEGASIMALCNPKSKSASGRMQLFADVEAGADYLKWLRK